VAVLSYMAVRGFLVLRAKRGFRDFDNTKVVKYDSLCGFLFLGWFLHYFPFYLMSRQLFLHHYFPALYFAILLFSGVFDLVTSTLRPRVRLQIAGVLIILAVWNFAHFSPLAYGGEWTKSKCNSSKWLKTWDFSCNDFHDTYAEYSGIAAPTPHTPPNLATGPHGVPVVDLDPEHTSAFVVKPEPGHNIFAGERPDVRSYARPPPPPPVVDEEKIISSAGQTTATAGSVEASVEAAASASAGSSEAVASAGSETASDPASSSASAAEVISSATPESKPLKPAGPLGEAEVEAEKVAQELFPDAVEK